MSHLGHRTGPAAAKRQPSEAPATRSVAARLRSSRAARPRIFFGNGSQRETSARLKANICISLVAAWRWNNTDCSPEVAEKGFISGVNHGAIKAALFAHRNISFGARVCSYDTYL